MRRRINLQSTKLQKALVALYAVAVMFFVVACEEGPGTRGPQGPTGPTGPTGPQGPAGTASDAGLGELVGAWQVTYQSETEVHDDVTGNYVTVEIPVMLTAEVRSDRTYDLTIRYGPTIHQEGGQTTLSGRLTAMGDWAVLARVDAYVDSSGNTESNLVGLVQPIAYTVDSSNLTVYGARFLLGYHESTITAARVN